MIDTQNEPKLLDDPLPADPIGVRLLQYFNHPWRHLRAKPVPIGEKIKWRLEKRYYLRKRNMWKDWKRKDIVIGLGFGNGCRRLMIDLDINSPYHPNNNYELYQKLLGILEDLGLCKQVVVQSSASGGIHLYYFFAEELPTYDVALTVRLALSAAGFKIVDGQLEIFPNTKPYVEKGKGFSNYKAHRLPLQPETGSILRSSFSLEYWSSSLAELAEAADWSAQGQDLEQFKKMMMLARQENQDFWKLAKKRRKVSEWRQHVLDFIEEGWTGFHQTNVLLLNIGIFLHVFLEKTGEELAEAMVEYAINLPGYREYCRHQHEIEKRCRDWARSIENFYRRLYQHPKRAETYRKMFNRTSRETPNGNKRKGSEASNRIKMAYNHLKDLGELPSKVTELIFILIKTAKELTGKGISKNTLFKEYNLVLWHPKHQNQTPSSEVEEETPSSEVEEETQSSEVQKETQDVTEGRQPDAIQIEVQLSGTEAIIQEELQPEAVPPEQDSEIPRPSEVVCEKPEKLAEPESVPGQGYEENSHTQGSMKGYALPQPPDFPPAPQELAGENPENEIKGGFGGNVAQPEGAKSAKESENEAKEAELARVAPLTADDSQPESEEALTLPKIKEKLNEFFRAAIAGFSTSEKWQLTKRRLELVSKAQHTAHKQYYLKKLTKSGVRDESLEDAEMRVRMRLFWESGIAALRAEVDQWCSFVDNWCHS